MHKRQLQEYENVYPLDYLPGWYWVPDSHHTPFKWYPWDKKLQALLQFPIQVGIWAAQAADEIMDAFPGPVKIIHDPYTLRESEYTKP